MKKSAFHTASDKRWDDLEINIRLCSDCKSHKYKHLRYLFAVRHTPGERPITWQLNLIKYKNDNDGKIQRLRVLDAIAVHWLKVGLNLEISEDHLRIIRERENNDPRKCAPAMVNKWLQSGQDPTWAKLIEALEDSKLATLVEDLKMALPRMKDDHIGPVLVTKDLETPDSQGL